VPGDHEQQAVTKCVCFDVTFEALRSLYYSLPESLRTIGTLHSRTGCGGRCGLCVPYIQVAIRRQVDTLPVMWTEDFRSEGVHPGAIRRLEETIKELMAELSQQPQPR